MFQQQRPDRDAVGVPDHIKIVVDKGYKYLTPHEIIDFCARTLADTLLSEKRLQPEAKELIGKLIIDKFNAAAKTELLNPKNEEILNKAFQGRAWDSFVSSIPHAVHTVMRRYQLCDTSPNSFYNPMLSQEYFNANRLEKAPNARQILRELFKKPAEVPVYFAKNLDRDHTRVVTKLEKMFLTFLPEKFEILDFEFGNDNFSALNSARCLSDKFRTYKFALGIKRALLCLRHKYANKEFSVIDAGCGSIPVQSICAALLDNNLRVTAIENNPLSIEIAKKIVSALNLQDRIDFINCDATKYCPKKKIDLLITETMDSGLLGEPIVQIMENLCQFLEIGGVCLPQKVSVSYAVVDQKKYANAKSYTMPGYGYFPRLNYQYIPLYQINAGDTPETIEFKIDFRKRKLKNDQLLLLASEVTVYNNVVLKHGESMITTVSNRHSDPDSTNTLKLSEKLLYRASCRPGGMLSIK